MADPLTSKVKLRSKYGSRRVNFGRGSMKTSMEHGRAEGEIGVSARGRGARAILLDAKILAADVQLLRRQLRMWARCHFRS